MGSKSDGARHMGERERARKRERGRERQQVTSPYKFSCAQFIRAVTREWGYSCSSCPCPQQACPPPQQLYTLGGASKCAPKHNLQKLILYRERGQMLTEPGEFAWLPRQIGHDPAHYLSHLPVLVDTPGGDERWGGTRVPAANVPSRSAPHRQSLNLNPSF